MFISELLLFTSGALPRPVSCCFGVLLYVYFAKVLLPVVPCFLELSLRMRAGWLPVIFENAGWMAPPVSYYTQCLVAGRDVCFRGQCALPALSTLPSSCFPP